MRRFYLTIVNILSLIIVLQAQVQFAAPAQNSSVSTSVKVASFNVDGSAGLLHDFKISDPTDCFRVLEGPDEKLYGTATGGDTSDPILFSMNEDGSGLKIIYTFPSASFSVPAFGPDGKLYIVVADTLYKMKLDGSSITAITVMPSRTNEIMIDSSGWIYSVGIIGNNQILYKIKIDGSGFQTLRTFDVFTEGIFNGTLCITPEGRIFLLSSGVSNGGAVVSINTDGTNYKVNKTFITGNTPILNAPLYSNGKIFFATTSTSPYNFGELESFDISTEVFSIIYYFTNAGAAPVTNPKIVNNKFIGLNKTGLYTLDENGTDFFQLNTISGRLLYSVIGTGNEKLIYNATKNKLFYIANGGAYQNYYVVRIDAANFNSRDLHDFGNVPDGYNPLGLTKGLDGILYGITQNGGATGGGTLYKLNVDGSGFQTIKSFNGDVGESPYGQLLYASDGRLYGVCRKRDIAQLTDDRLIYGINTDGTSFSVLHNFIRNNDGTLVPELIEGETGELFGLTGMNQSPEPNNIFKLNKNGTGYTILKTLSGSRVEGDGPRYGLVNYKGYLYGATEGGGASGAGVIFKIKEDGSGFKVIKNFNSGNTASFVAAGITLASNNKLYGYHVGGGNKDSSFIFSINLADDSFQEVYHNSANDGFYLTGNFIQASDDRLYITSSKGLFGINLDGTNPHVSIFPGYEIYPTANLVYLTEIPVQSSIELCPPAGSALFISAINGSSYQWQINTGSGFNDIFDNNYYTGTNTQNIHLNNIPSLWYGYQYRCLTNGSKTNNIYTIKFADSWVGNLNSAWENPANWSCGNVPDDGTDVIINNGSVILNSNDTIRSLKINAGGNLTIKTGFNLTVTH
ncbi:MAG: choice-of-anchor tandem repeat GloVer-containing protein [Ginsengibacter sp.]